jgi:hypothetical protein
MILSRNVVVSMPFENHNCSLTLVVTNALMS